MRAIEDVLKDLPLGVSALAEQLIDSKQVTCIIIKDDFKHFLYLTNAMEFYFKGACIKSNKVISGHLIVKLKDALRERHYPFHFNYYDEKVLSLIVKLSYQKKLYLVISNKYNEYKIVCFKNNLRKFFKKYMINCISCGYKWDDEDYKKSIDKLICSFPDINHIWDKLGGEITMNVIKKQ